MLQSLILSEIAIKDHAKRVVFVACVLITGFAVRKEEAFFVTGDPSACKVSCLSPHTIG